MAHNTSSTILTRDPWLLAGQCDLTRDPSLPGINPKGSFGGPSHVNAWGLHHPLQLVGLLPWLGSHGLSTFCCCQVTQSAPHGELPLLLLLLPLWLICGLLSELTSSNQSSTSTMLQWLVCASVRAAHVLNLLLCCCYCC